MKRCPSLWQVEALRDGRLTNEEQERFAEHLRSCGECMREQQLFERLGDALRTLPTPHVDERTLRQRRQALLERAHQSRQKQAPEGRPRARRYALVGVVGAACVAGLTLSVVSFSPHSEPVVDEGPRVELEADEGAIYRRKQVSSATIVELEQGRVTLRVHRVSQAQRVLVQTPDGEVEDVGTVFAVAVQAQKTRLVQVYEGRVAVRLKDHTPFVLQAGESYGPIGDADPQVSPIHDEPPNSAFKEGGGSSGAVHEHRHRRHRPAGVVHPPAQEVHSEAAHAFSQAVARLERGDAPGAAALFHAFLLHYDDTAYAEDAAFLRVVALARAGETKEVRVAAAAYLKRYPSGFRAKDVERMLGDGGRPRAAPRTDE